MRYLIAIIAAVAVALLVTIYVSSPVASWVVRQFAFDSPDSVADLHALVFMAVNLGGLILGWLLGWAIGGAFEKDEPVE
ncbi:MAG: hypothetical protein ACWGMY_10395 [Hyphomicrobiaceae bacterium]